MSDKPNLLEELGLDEETLSWWQLGVCGGRQSGSEGMPLNWFFSDYEADPQLAIAMDEVCLRCPVIRECLMDAAKYKDDGLRGGIYLNKGKPDKQYNAHKTPEVWARIRERVDGSQGTVSQ